MRLAIFLLTLLFAAPVYAETCTHTVSVSGNQLLRDGSPWQPHGMNSLVVLTYPSQAGSSYKNAQTVWNVDGGATDIAQLKSWGADTVRLQMAQPSLDPFSPNYDATYEPYIAGVVQKWCAAGFSVILSMQASALSAGWNQPFDFATDATYRAWQNLAPIWLSEPNVIIELFNEPSNSGNYKNGGGDTTPPTRTPRNNQWQDWVDNANWLMRRLRAAGAASVFGVDGIGSAHFLAGGPTTFSGDPTNQWFYVAHTYPLDNASNTLAFKNFTPDFMEFAWGSVAASKPVVIDEWSDGTNGGAGNQYCYDSTSGTPTDSPGVATTLLTYLQDAALNTGVMVTDGDYFQGPQTPNTGTGSISGLARNAGSPHGNYVIAMTSTTSATVTDPNNVNLGTATVGTPFHASEIWFLITGSPAPTDKFVLTVPTHSLIGLIPFNWEGHNPSNWVDDYTSWVPTYFYTQPFLCNTNAPANSPGYMVQQYFLNPSAAIVSPTTPPP